MHISSENQIEGFILKWTFISVFVGISLMFIVKVLILLGGYVTSGKLILDFSSYIWSGLKSVIFGS